MKYNVYVCCGGNLMGYNSQEEAKKFYLDCMNCSEGSERERYTTIYLELQDTNCRFASDHTSKVFNTSIDLDKLSFKEYNDVKKYFDLSDDDLDYIQANFKLNKLSKRIYSSEIEKYDHDFEKFYNQQPDYNRYDRYYIIDSEKSLIICFDNSCSEYFCEEFALKDYDYAYQWLNNEIEYEDYLNRDKGDFEI